MSHWSRITNVFRSRKLNSELDEEMQSHIDEALEHGRDPEEVRRAFGSRLRAREYSRDVKLVSWIDALRADLLFGTRQLWKNKISSGAAILSLALAIGACTSAFRLIDAVLLRPLPVANPDNLFVVTYQVTNERTGKVDTGDSFEYPIFRNMRTAIQDNAALLAISYANRQDLTYSSDDEMEKAHRQYVSGSMFRSFGLKPALGRLLTDDDDRKPGAHPYAVISHDYWTRRFGRDPKSIGRTFRMGGHLYEIVGVAEQGFTGTEPGTMTDVFIPTMMNAEAIDNPNWGWFRTWVHFPPNAPKEQIRQTLQSVISSSRREYSKEWVATTPKKVLDDFINAPVNLEPANTGLSGMQKTYRRSLTVLGVLVVLVLLIACANVANLMTAQASSRGREMALRISIGAGRWRLIQLVLLESALIAVIASALGGLFAWWSAPFVVSMLNPPDNPARFILPADLRVLGFAVLLAILVTFLFGLVPALRASAVKPMSTLKGGEDPHSRRRLMNALVAAQVSFCFLVHFLAGLFVSTFDRLAHQPTGFSADRLLILETSAKNKLPYVTWSQVTDQLRSVPGVEAAALAGWPLMGGNAWRMPVWLNGHQPDGNLPYFFSASPGWLDTMRIQLVDGRDFRPEDDHPAVAIVNESFARRYFDGGNPIGKSFEIVRDKKRVRTQIIGYVKDARYTNMRDPMRETVYVPFNSMEGDGQARPINWATFVVRTTGPDPLTLAPMLRQEIKRARSEMLVSNITTQAELVQRHTLRERLLAMLSMFFAVVALVLASVGLYGVLNYSVLQRRREIGIRMALGAQATDVARRVTAEVFGMLLLGSVAGLAAGIASERYFETLLYQVKGTDLTMLAIPALTIFTAAVLAALPPVIRAVRTDPAMTLRSE